MNIEGVSQRETSNFLEQATSDFLQRATSATSNERILQRVTSDFTTSNEQRVKSYVSKFCHFLEFLYFLNFSKFFIS